MAITGSEFAATYGPKGFAAWEAAAIDLAKKDELTPWPFVPLTLTDGTNTAIVQIMIDVIGIGPRQDQVRLPLLPGTAQAICNLFGWLLPTPWLAYQAFHQATIKLATIGEVPNKGASMSQYVEHSKAIDRQLAAVGQDGASRTGLVSGIKKHIVISNIYKPNTVVIFGWYRPPPAPDVYDDGQPWDVPTGTRQPIQAKSNEHGAFYVDYSHGVQPIAGTCMVNGQPRPTIDLYTDPELSSLVSNENAVGGTRNVTKGSPLRVPRYPAPIPPATPRPVGPPLTKEAAVDVIPTFPGLGTQGLDRTDGRG